MFYATHTVLRRSLRHPSIAHARGQLDVPHTSPRPGPPVVPSLWYKVTPEKVSADRVTGLRPLWRSGNGVPGRWTGGGGVEQRSESRTAIQLDRGSGVLRR